MPFTNNINPALFHLGPFEVRLYGIVYALGFLLAYYVLNRERKKGRLELSEGDIDNFIILLAFSIIAGARIFHVAFWNTGFYLSNPLQILMLWKGGLSFHGGLIGAIIAAYYFCKKKKMPVAKLADLLAMPAALMLAFGRIANFINGELWGTRTSVPWCVNFMGVEGCRHPYQLYEAATRFIITGALAAISRMKLKDGFLFWNFIGMMGISRFIADFYRDDALFYGMTIGQYFSIIMIVAAIYAMLEHYKSDLKQ